MDTSRLRRTAALLRNGASCEETAADQLESAADEIQALMLIKSERDTLAAKLAELEGQEPVVFIKKSELDGIAGDSFLAQVRGIPDDWHQYPLFARHVPGESVNAQLLTAAKTVLDYTHLDCRPPVRDEIECGRMASVRVHALADLHEAVQGAETGEFYGHAKVVGANDVELVVAERDALAEWKRGAEWIDAPFKADALEQYGFTTPTPREFAKRIKAMLRLSIEELQKDRDTLASRLRDCISALAGFRKEMLMAGMEGSSQPCDAERRAAEALTAINVSPLQAHATGGTANHDYAGP